MREPQPRHIRRTHLVLASALAFVAISCGHDATGPSAPVVQSVTVTPAQFTLRIGQGRTVVVVARDANGAVISSETPAWSSSNPSIATVSASGLVSAADNGTDTITATVGGVSGRSFVTVTPVPVVAVSVTPSPATLYVGQTRTFTALPMDSVGGALTGRPVAWRLSDTTLATVDGAGVVTARAVGTATVTATVDGVAGTSVVTVAVVPVAAIHVLPPADTLESGSTDTLTATAYDSAGHVLAGRTFTWTSADSSVVAVTQAGVVSTRDTGKVTISAMAGGKTGSASVVVTARVASVIVLPDSALAYVGQTRQYAAAARDSNGNAVPGRPVAWVSLDTALASVTSTGLATARAPGVARVVAMVDGLADTARLVIELVPVDTVSVAPSSVSMLVGGSRTLTATPKDSAGTALTGRVVTWASTDTNVAVVANGVVTGRGVGTDTIVATVDGKSGRSVVAVSAVPVATVVVTPAVDSLYLGAKVQLTAVTKDSAGGVLTGRLVTWQVSQSFARVDSTGLVTAVGPQTGLAVVTATSEGKSGSAQVVVRQPQVGSVVVSPRSDTIRALGDTIRATAVVRDSAGGALPGVSVTWTSQSPYTAIVDSTGLVTGQHNGSVWVFANAFGKRDSIQVVVQQVAAGVAISPRADTLRQINATGPLSAEYVDARGSAMTAAHVTWSSADTSIVAVDSTGEVSARAVGTAWVRALSSQSYKDSAMVVVDVAFGSSCSLLGGTLHPGNTAVVHSETWTAAQSPHFVGSGEVVDSGAVLTVQAGATVCVSGGLAFERGGRLVALGTAPAPIVFTPTTPSGSWGGLEFDDPVEPDPVAVVVDTSYLSNVLIERVYGGGGSSGFPQLSAIAGLGQHHVLLLDSVRVRQTQWGGAVHLNAPGSRLNYSVIDTTGAPTDAYPAVQIGADSVTLSHVVIRRSGSAGIWSQRGRFNLDSVEVADCQGTGLALGQGTDVQLTEVSVHGCTGDGLELLQSTGLRATDVRSVGNAGYGFHGSIDALLAIAPTPAAQDSLLGNGKDTLYVDGGTAHAPATIRVDVPWRIGGSGFAIDSGAKLVVQPGAHVAADQISYYASITFSRGGWLDARGTAGAPIVFAPSVSTQSWGGLEFDDPVEPDPVAVVVDTSYLSNVRLERVYASRDPGCGCEAPALDGAGPHHVTLMDSITIRQTFHGAAVLLGAPGSRLTNSTIDTTGDPTTISPAVHLSRGTSASGIIVRRSGSDGVVMEDSTSLTSSEITGSVGDGVKVSSGSALGMTIAGNNLVENAGLGVDQPVAAAVNAEGNWWGDPAGPNGPSGDGVSANVDYANWLTSAVAIP